MRIVKVGRRCCEQCRDVIVGVIESKARPEMETVHVCRCCARILVEDVHMVMV